MVSPYFFYNRDQGTPNRIRYSAANPFRSIHVLRTDTRAKTGPA